MTDRDIALPSIASLLSMKVPVPLLLYAILGAMDFAFSRIAFSLGVAEGNPILGAALAFGLFDVSKAMLTMAVLAIGTLLWRLSSVRRVVLAANMVMSAIAVFHIYGIWLHA